MPVLVVAALILVFPISRLTAQNTKPTEYEVKAAYLFNFGKFVTWPPNDTSSSAPFVICVLGEDPFGPILDKTTAGETINGKRIADKRIVRPEEARDCSILYISAAQSEHLNNILAAVKDAPVLTVSDMPGFVQRGGMIQFLLDQGRVRFEVNLGPAQPNHLVVSSELLKVAVKVIRGSQENR
jgi:hypothetical protein